MRKEKNSNKQVKRPDADYTLGKKENKGWLKLRHKTLASCCTSQTSLYILGNPKLYPAQVFTFKSIRAATNVLDCVDKSPAQEVGCVLCGVFFFPFSFSFKKGALFKIGLTLFNVACHKLAIMVSPGFATDYVNLQQINYLLAHDCTHNTL